ncbi:MAG: hypothetical protein EXQ99_01170 [Alphaproteobacteria bacterium]|nr:hypothetical protein [Alphaproteobacteria bacterium]
MGAPKFSTLTKPKIETFAAELIETRSRVMARKVLASLNALIEAAQSRGEVAQNVARSVKITLPKRGKRKITPPTKDELRAIIEKAAGRWRPLILTAAFVGLRSSQLRGLRWADVDLTTKMIAVRQRADAWGQIGALKSEAGHRDVPILARRSSPKP